MIAGKINQRKIPPRSGNNGDLGFCGGSPKSRTISGNIAGRKNCHTDVRTDGYHVQKNVRDENVSENNRIQQFESSYSGLPFNKKLAGREEKRSYGAKAICKAGFKSFKQ